ncbi:tryptophan 7-halogenase [Bradyrhizobium sp. USDA 10063]
MHAAVILGGGIAGCATALALRQRGLDDILIVEAGSYDTFQIGETIPPDTRLLLERLHIWNGFIEDRHEPCLGSRSAWGTDDIGYNDFLLNPRGAGWHLDRRKFGAFMAREARERGAELRSGARFVSAERVATDVFELRLETAEGPQRLHARFVIDATGPRRRFARIMGATPLLHDRLLWFGAVLDRPASPDFSRLTMLEAVENGWWYAANLPGERVVVAGITDAETNRRAMAHRPDRWLSALASTKHMAGWLADCNFGDHRRTIIRFAPCFLLDRVCGDSWLAVGDSASAYDPIASQGIHKALLDGLQSAAAIADHLAGGSAALEQYQASVIARFADYLTTRDYFYGLERRWPASPFWRNRRTQSARLMPGAGVHARAAGAMRDLGD